MTRPTRLRSLRGCAGCRFERFRSPAIYLVSSTSTRCRTLRSMPARTGLSAMSLVLPIRPRPGARSVPRWRADWPIWLRTCVSFSFGNGGHLLGRALHLVVDGRDLVRQDLADLLAARPGDVLGTAQLAKRLLGGLEHVDRVRRAE